MYTTSEYHCFITEILRICLVKGRLLSSSLHSLSLEMTVYPSTPFLRTVNIGKSLWLQSTWVVELEQGRCVWELTYCVSEFYYQFP